MISKKNRVPLRQLPEFFKNANRLQNQDFRIYVVPNGKHSRVAVVVPKKQLKKATKRNRLRRRTLAILKTQLPLLPNVDVVVMPSGKLLEASVSKIESSLLSVLKKIPSK